LATPKIDKNSKLIEMNMKLSFTEIKGNLFIENESKKNGSQELKNIMPWYLDQPS